MDPSYTKPPRWGASAIQPTSETTASGPTSRCTTALSAPDPGLGAPIGPCWLCEGRDSRACVICGPVATSTEGPSGVGRPRAVLVRLGLELRVKRVQRPDPLGPSGRHTSGFIMFYTRNS